MEFRSLVPGGDLITCGFYFTVFHHDLGDDIDDDLGDEISYNDLGDKDLPDVKVPGIVLLVMSDDDVLIDDVYENDAGVMFDQMSCKVPQYFKKLINVNLTAVRSYDDYLAFHIIIIIIIPFDQVRKLRSLKRLSKFPLKR